MFRKESENKIEHNNESGYILEFISEREKGLVTCHIRRALHRWGLSCNYDSATFATSTTE